MKQFWEHTGSNESQSLFAFASDDSAEEEEAGKTTKKGRRGNESKAVVATNGNESDNCKGGDKKAVDKKEASQRLVGEEELKRVVQRMMLEVEEKLAGCRSFAGLQRCMPAVMTKLYEKARSRW